MAKKKATKKEQETEETVSYDFLPDLTELEPKYYVRVGFLYYLEQRQILIKSKSDLEKKFKDYMKKD